MAEVSMFGKKKSDQREPAQSRLVYRDVNLSGTCVDCGTTRTVTVKASPGGCPSSYGACTCGSTIPVIFQ